MSFDPDYARNFFDVWYDGFCNAMEQEQAGIVSNEGRMLPEIPKARLP